MHHRRNALVILVLSFRQVAQLVTKVIENMKRIVDEDDTDDEEEVAVIEKADEEITEKIESGDMKLIDRLRTVSFEDDESMDSFESSTFIQAASPIPSTRGTSGYASGSPQKILSTHRLTMRRPAVSSESIDVNTLKEQIASIKIFPKDAEQIKSLYEILSKSMILRRMLEPEERTFIIKALQGPVVYPGGTTIFKQGEIGHSFYLVESGSVDVFVQRELHFLSNESHTDIIQQDSVKVHSYQAGDVFGQLALLHPTPRAATCIAGGSKEANEQVVVWTLDRKSFKILLAGASIRKREMFFAYLKQVPILQTLTFEERLQLADQMQEKSYETDSLVYEESSIGHANGKGNGNELFLILDGMVDCYQKKQFMMSLSAGQSFGEIAILVPHKPRSMTVRTKTLTRMLVIDRATFERMLGPLEVLLQRNTEVYMQYAAELPKVAQLAIPGAGVMNAPPIPLVSGSGLATTAPVTPTHISQKSSVTMEMKQ